MRKQERRKEEREQKRREGGRGDKCLRRSVYETRSRNLFHYHTVQFGQKQVDISHRT